MLYLLADPLLGATEGIFGQALIRVLHEEILAIYFNVILAIYFHFWVL